MIHVLLVDSDKESLKSAVRDLLQEVDILVSLLTSPQEVLDRIQSETVEVVVASDSLPDTAGMVILKEMRSHGFLLPFVLLTGSREIAREALQRGADYCFIRDEQSLELLPQVVRNLARKWAGEEHLRRDNRIMNAILDASPLAMGVVKDHVIIWMNELMPRMLGYTEHELIGTDPLLLIPGEEEHRRIDKGLYGTNRRGTWGSVDAQLKRKDGTLLSCHLQSRPVDSSDPSQGYIIIGQDTTEYMRLKDLIRKNELRYQDLIDTSKSIILRTDTEGTIKFINRYGESFFGYSLEELVGKNVVGTILPRKSRAGRDLFSMVQEVMHNPEEYEVNVNENMKKDGERIWIAWTNKAIRDDQGNLVEILSIGTDITDRKVNVQDLKDSFTSWKQQLLEGTDIDEPVFDAAYGISVEISREGREGKPVGTTFLLGDAGQVLTKSRQLILNPFEGHPAEVRLITSNDIRETIKELSQLDGAFVVRGDGVMEAAGRYITIDTSGTLIPKGLGTRHASVAGITQETKAVGIVVSQSGGRISIFKDGRIVRVITLNE